MNTPLAKELEIASQLARTAGKLAQRYFAAWHGGKDPDGKLAVEWKDGDEPVTVADRAVSEMCVDCLRREFPDDAILSEETPDDGARRNARRTWLIDPIDGTKDFIAGRPGYSVMIGLLMHDATLGSVAPALGVVYQPPLDRLWYATLGNGAYCVEGEGPVRQMHVSSLSRLQDARMVSSASIREPLVAEVRERAGIRDEVQIGSVGIKLSLIGAGERDLYVNPAGRTKLWDTCAPNIILTESGGLFSDCFGQQLEYSGDLSHPHGLLASNGLLHPQALAQIAPLMKRQG